jgi:hypothetical protein
MSSHVKSFHVISCHFKCHWAFPTSFRLSREGQGKGGRGGGVKYVFLSLRRQLRCQAEGKKASPPASTYVTKAWAAAPELLSSLLRTEDGKGGGGESLARACTPSVVRLACMAWRVLMPMEVEAG